MTILPKESAPHWMSRNTLGREIDSAIVDVVQGWGMIAFEFIIQSMDENE